MKNHAKIKKLIDFLSAEMLKVTDPMEIELFNSKILVLKQCTYIKEKKTRALYDNICKQLKKYEKAYKNRNSSDVTEGILFDAWSYTLWDAQKETIEWVLDINQTQ